MEKKYGTMSAEAQKDGETFLKLAKQNATDGIYREGTPEFDNLTEAYTSFGIAIALASVAAAPYLHGYFDDGSDDS